jgi:putative oxidoreductase
MNALIQRIDGMLEQTHRAAFVALWLALIAQVVWTSYDYVHLHPPLGDILYPLIFVPAAALLAITGGRVRWVAPIPRLLISLGFLDNVADRFGLLGPPGAPYVSWGDFHHFIAYTAQVNAFAPRALIPALAVMATIGEGTLGLAMLLGVRTRLAAASSAVLLVVFGTAMVLSGLSQFQYNVYLMAAAGWALATIDASALSVDGVVKRLRRASSRDLQYEPGR